MFKQKACSLLFNAINSIPSQALAANFDFRLTTFHYIHFNTTHGLAELTIQYTSTCIPGLGNSGKSIAA